MRRSEARRDASSGKPCSGRFREGHEGETDAETCAESRRDTWGKVTLQTTPSAREVVIVTNAEEGWIDLSCKARPPARQHLPIPSDDGLIPLTAWLPACLPACLPAWLAPREPLRSSGRACGQRKDQGWPSVPPAPTADKSQRQPSTTCCRTFGSLGIVPLGWGWGGSKVYFKGIFRCPLFRAALIISLYVLTS